MKLYKTMRPTENLSWCKPLCKSIGPVQVWAIQNEGEIVSWGIKVQRSKMWEPTTQEEQQEIEKILQEDAEEKGCCECPWRDECEAMNE